MSGLDTRIAAIGMPPSVHPNSLSPCRNASGRLALREVDEHANTTHALTLLRADREGPRVGNLCMSRAAPLSTDLPWLWTPGQTTGDAHWGR
jgi:hypothetical protein